MKQLILLILCTAWIVPTFGQQMTLTNPTVTIGQKTNTSLPFNELNDDRSIWPRTRPVKDGYVPKKDWILHENIDPTALPLGDDPAWQSSYAPSRVGQTNRTVDSNWDGAGFTGVNPADPSLDVGPNHVVQMINNSSSAIVRVWDKTGIQISSVLLSSITGVGGAGDPIVIYDQLVDRWLISEFASSGNVLVVAVSTGPDPTGAYVTYQFPTPDFPDYPKYSIWPDAYYVTTNENSGKVYALERDEMIAGAPSAQMVEFALVNFPTIGFQAATPTSLSGTTLPPPGTPQYIMRMADDAWTSSTTDVDRLEVFEFVVDWTNTANSTFSGSTDYNTLPFDTELCGYTSFACMDQPGTATTLDPLRELLMNRIFYRNFGTHESIVCNHVTDVDGTDRGGVRWYELQRSGAAWSIHQQGTYSPDADDRWMAGIAINASGAIGLAYNVSSSSTFPSIRHTGRLATDPLGMMTEPETDLAVGSASNSSNRWGDYNCLVVDPANDNSFWFTGKYNTSSNWSTRVSEFSFAPLIPQVAFASSGFEIAETNEIPDGCLSYKEHTVTLNIATGPSMPVDITITSTGDAVEGIMQDVLVMPKTFSLDSNNLTQTITLRVYDDRAIEGSEFINLAYLFNANGGDATAGSVAQTFNLTILDNDVIPTDSLVELYAEDFDPAPTDITITDGGTSNDTWEFVPTAIGSNSLDGTPFAFVDSDAAGSGVQLNEIMDFPVTPLVPGRLAILTFDEYYRAFTDNSELGYVDVYDGSTWQRILTHDSGSGTIGDWSNPNPVSLDVTAYANINFQVRIGYEAIYDWWWAIDNISISQEAISGIATTVTLVNDTFHLGAEAEVIAIDENDRIIAKIKNLSTHNFGCATLAIDRAGTGSTLLPGDTDASLAFADKTYFLSFLDGNQTGNSYEITLYYTDAEKQGWESATGKMWTDTSTVMTRFDQTVSSSSSTSASEIGLTVMNSTEFDANAVRSIFSNGPGGFGISNRDIDNSCLSYLSISGNPSSGEYLALDSIDSDALIIGNKTIIYSAGINVELLGNFHVQSGSDFTAGIGGCGISPLSLLAFRNSQIEANQLSLQNTILKNPHQRKTTISSQDAYVTVQDRFITIGNLSTKNHMSPRAYVSFRKKGKVVDQISTLMKPASNGTYMLVFEQPTNIDLDATSFMVDTHGYRFFVK